MTPIKLKAVWRRYLKSRADEDRNLLVENYLPLVKYIAARVWANLPQGVELDDLVSSGVFGLMDALKTFEPVRGFKFETYAHLRIRGSMLDELRNMDWVPRLIRAKANLLRGASGELQRKLGRDPTADELAKALGLSVRELEKMQREVQPVEFASLSKKWYETDSFKDVSTVQMLVDRKGEDPTRRVQAADIMRLVTRLLNRNERLIVILYYYEGQTMRQIGKQLDLSESRVSQMHTQIMAGLETRLAHRRPEIAAA